MNSKPAKIKDVGTDHGQLTVWLDDGRIVGLPLTWYPSLAEASHQERAIWQSSGAGGGIHWPALDYDLNVEDLLQGRREHPNALCLTRLTRAQNHPQRKTSTHAWPRKLRLEAASS